MTRFAFVFAWFLFAASAQAEAPSVYVVAVPDTPEARAAALEVFALSRAALAESEGFRVREPDVAARGELRAARDAYAAALGALRHARQAYLAFELDSARASLDQALKQFDAAWPVIDSPEPVAQALMYLGACHVLSGDNAAGRRVFTRYHVAYGALAPDERIFNPQVMVEFRDAQRELGARPRAKLVIDAAADAEVALDGRTLGLGPRTVEVAPGEHVVRASVAGSEPVVARATVRARGSEKVALTTPEERLELAALLAGAGDAAQADALRQALAVDALAVIRVADAGEGQLTLSLGARGAVAPGADDTRTVGPEVDARVQATRALVAAFLDRVAAQAHAANRPLPRVAETPLPMEHPPAEPPPQRAWYKRAWVWVAVGVVVAGGATTAALMLSGGDKAASPKTEGGTLTLEF